MDGPVISAARSTSRLSVLPLVPAMAYLSLFFLVPMGLIVVFSFFGFADGSMYPAFTLEQYAKFLADDYYRAILLHTLVIAIGVGILTAVLGYPVAYYLVRGTSRWKNVVLLLVLLPLMASVVVRTYGWLVLLNEQGILNQLLAMVGLGPLTLINSYAGVFIGMVHVLLPYSVLSIMASLQALHPSLELAAQDLGAGRIATFTRVTLPLTLPGVLTGFALTFSLTLSAYATPHILGGVRVQTAATAIYDFVLLFLDWPLASAISIIVLGVSMAVLYVVGRFQTRGAVVF